MEEQQPTPIISTPIAILIGAVIISIAILVSGGVIRLKSSASNNVATNTTTKQVSPEEILTSIAKDLKLDASKFKQCLTSGKYQEEVSKDITAAQDANASGTPTFLIGKSSANGQIEGVSISGALPFNVFKAVFDKYLTNASAEQILKSADELQLGSQKAKLADLLISANASVDDDPVLGNKDAPVTLIEFSDYECPFCKRHFTQTYDQLKRDYINPGKVKLVYRDFIAVPAHNPWAQKEAMAADCAREQGGDPVYFRFHDELYNRTKSNGDGIS